MQDFFSFFYDFITSILLGFLDVFKGILQVFNFPKFIKIFAEHRESFSPVDYVFAIISFIIVIALYVLMIYLLYMFIRKYIQLRKSLKNQEDLLVELSNLNRQVIKLNAEKDKILAMKMSEIGLPHDEFDKQALQEQSTENQSQKVESNFKEQRFFKLAAVDKMYMETPNKEYEQGFTLEELCEKFRKFACSRMGLYYDINIMRLFFAGMGSTKLILIQGISGTGKTSLPYAFGKFMEADATMASVQPSWRDRSELFGYFNEFTKRFNETEVLKRIYEASYNNDINIIILDEMNIARVEYYFAEMLSVLEMPNPDEWKIDLVPNSWPTDPVNLVDGKLKIPRNVWYIGTANNDDSTFAVSDKVYDRAFPINMDTKGEKFECEDTGPLHIGFDYLDRLFEEAIATYPVSNENLEKIAKLDIYVIEKLRIAFGNRILKQLKDFVPVYVACGGSEIDGIDYILAHKIFRKFESLNLAYIRDELDGLIDFMNKTFGKSNMKESKAYVERLKKLY
ncbi:MAG: hypothetical protein ACOYJS_01480 [Acutalibacteraceae bacterium]|jgi:hypothetical protein